MKNLAIQSIKVEGNRIRADISDGRIVSIPVSWFPRLQNATQSQLEHFEISPDGYGIHWPELDEDISIKSFVA